jgi:hypothetical protein
LETTVDLIIGSSQNQPTCHGLSEQLATTANLGVSYLKFHGGTMPILHWLNKHQAVKTVSQCAYRLLEEVSALSYGDADNSNMLIQGDNLEALKALIPFYAGQVKCIYIDHRTTPVRPSAITTTIWNIRFG